MVSLQKVGADASPGEPVQWQFFTDADMASDRSPENKRKSRSGFIATANGFPVSYSSKTTTSAMAHPDLGTDGHADISSAASEVYAAGNATIDTLGLSYCAAEMGELFPKPFILQMDNNAAQIFCKNTALNTKLKHIDQRQEWVKALRDRGIMTPVYVNTKENLADMFTKPLTGDTFRYLRNKFLVRKLDSANSK